jgi:hypothetical protein
VLNSFPADDRAIQARAPPGRAAERRAARWPSGRARAGVGPARFLPDGALMCIALLLACLFSFTKLPHPFPLPPPQVARAVVGAICASSYPLNHHPARAAWEASARAPSPSTLPARAPRPPARPARAAPAPPPRRARPQQRPRGPRPAPIPTPSLAQTQTKPRPPPQTPNPHLTPHRQDLLDSLAGVKDIPPWASRALTTLFVASTVGSAMAVTDLGSVLHIVGGTAAAFMVRRAPPFARAAGPAGRRRGWAAGSARPPCVRGPARPGEERRGGAPERPARRRPRAAAG